MTQGRWSRAKKEKKQRKNAKSTPTVGIWANTHKNNGGDEQKTNKHRRERIFVPERTVNGGLDQKFITMNTADGNDDSNNINLYGMMTTNEFNDAITTINETIKPSRSKKVDGALLATGPLIFPLAGWAVRQKKRKKKRKALLEEGINQFNTSHPDLYMKWNRSPKNCLTIERRSDAELYGVIDDITTTNNDLHTSSSQKLMTTTSTTSTSLPITTTETVTMETVTTTTPASPSSISNTIDSYDSTSSNNNSDHQEFISNIEEQEIILNNDSLAILA